MLANMGCGYDLQFICCDLCKTMRFYKKTTGIWDPSQYKDTSIGIPIVKMERSWDRLFFITEIPIPGKTALILRRGPNPGEIPTDCMTTRNDGLRHAREHAFVKLVT